MGVQEVVGEYVQGAIHTNQEITLYNTVPCTTEKHGEKYLNLIPKIG